MSVQTTEVPPRKRSRRLLVIGLASLLEQDGLDEEAALANEFRHGMISLTADGLGGAARFAAGEGRHGEGV